MTALEQAADTRANRKGLRYGSVPVVLSSLVGRERDVAAVRRFLVSEGRRLLTLTGPGGVGKTRLAIRIAEELAGDFGDGVAFVSLAPISDPTSVLQAIAQVVGIRETPDWPLAERLVHSLGDRHLLMILDNFEHVTAAAPVVDGLLTECPRVQVVVTSRTPLHLSGEQEYAVPPLAVGGDEESTEIDQARHSPAVSLFVERARAANPAFDPAAGDVATIAAICRRLDGLPLAIELAAPRTRLLTPAGLLRRLAGTVGTVGEAAGGEKMGREPPLQLLTGGARDLPARQQTIRDAIAWSYDLLEPEEQVLLRRLSVFAGGFTLEAAEYVGGEAARRQGDEGNDDSSLPRGRLAASPPSVFDGVTSLVDKSLVRAETGAEGAARFGMLETIREFARESLDVRGEGEEVRRRHAAWCLGLAEAAEPELSGPEQGIWLDTLERENGNLRAALAWADDRGEAELALRLAGALWRFWGVRGHLREERVWVERALALEAPGDLATLPALRAKALNNLGNLALDLNDFAQARTRYEESLAIRRALGDRSGAANTLNNLAILASNLGDYATARGLYEASLAVRRELGDRQSQALALSNLASALIAVADYDEAAALLDEALAIRQELGDVRGIAFSTYYLGEVARGRGEHERANGLFQQSARLFREIGDRRGLAFALIGLGHAANDRREIDAAAFVEALTIRRALGDRRGIAEAFEGLAVTAELLGELERTAFLLGAAAALRERVGSPLPPSAVPAQQRTVAEVKRKLGGEPFARAWVAGENAGLDDVTAAAMTVAERGASRDAMTKRQETERSAATDDVVLTRRERDVLRLLAEGHSDRRIAEALQLSPRTVSNHVARLLDKLGVPSRAAAVAHALRRGLVRG